MSCNLVVPLQLTIIVANEMIEGHGAPIASVSVSFKL